MAEIREIELDREFIVRLKGKVSTNQTDKELAEIFDNLHETIKEVICNNIVDDGVVSVEPVVHGRWEQVDETKCRCSHCDIIALIGLYPHGDKNYCPNCGAKMDGKED